MLLRELFEARILQEYDRSKTAATFGNKLINAFTADRGYQASLGNDIRTKLAQGLALTPEIRAQLIEYILSSIEETDPTTHKEYAQWLAKVYANEGITLQDITNNGYDWLENYDKLKKHKLLPPEFKDIGRVSFKTLGDLAANQEYASKLASAADKTADKGTSEEIYNDADIRIINPQNQSAACYYGQGTKWCTAASKDNKFADYAADGNLYILIPKKPTHAGEKYQFHFETNSYMNEQNLDIDAMGLFKRFPQLREVFNDMRYKFDSDEWYSDEELDNIRKKYFPTFEKALIERFTPLAKLPIEQLIPVKDQSVFEKVPSLEPEVRRIFAEGYAAKRNANALFNIALMTKPDQLPLLIQTVEYKEELFYQNEERDIDDEFSSYWTAIKNECAKQLWEAWRVMLSQKIPYKPIMAELSKTMLRNGLEVWQGITNGQVR
jgi:hypothetical protein